MPRSTAAGRAGADGDGPGGCWQQGAVWWRRTVVGVEGADGGGAGDGGMRGKDGTVAVEGRPWTATRASTSTASGDGTGGDGLDIQLQGSELRP